MAMLAELPFEMAVLIQRLIETRETREDATILKYRWNSGPPDGGVKKNETMIFKHLSLIYCGVPVKEQTGAPFPFDRCIHEYILLNKRIMDYDY